MIPTGSIGTRLWMEFPRNEGCAEPFTPSALGTTRSTCKPSEHLEVKPLHMISHWTDQKAARTTDTGGNAPDKSRNALDMHGKALDSSGKAQDLAGKAKNLRGKASDRRAQALDKHGNSHDLSGKAHD